MFCSSNANGFPNLASCGNLKRLAEISIGRRFVGFRLRRIPDPFGLLQIDISAGRVARRRLLVTANPLTLPVLGVQKSHRPLSRGAPFAGMIVLIPYLDLPE